MAFHDEPDVVASARDAARRSPAPLLLAVSGGVDSMTLLDAMWRAAPERIAAIATFDHATGDHSARAVKHVLAAVRRRGLRAIVGRMPEGADRSNGLEAMWRAARHAFLRETAETLGARVATAHTRDDQVETVLLRVLRGSGARGLAALAAPGPIARPFLGIPRASIERYARQRRLGWVDDPSNARLDFLRNRIRHELLPAMRLADPGIEHALWCIGERAAEWRVEVESLVDRSVAFRQPDERTLVVAASELAGYDRDSLRVLWSALAGRVGLALDGRGTSRCAAFTMSAPRGGMVPLSGGWRLDAVRGELVLHRATDWAGGERTLPEQGALEWGRFRFSAEGSGSQDDAWSAELSTEAVPLVRRWRSGDRLAPSRGQGRRRVTRYLAEARIPGSVRASWPVVEQGGEIVWIPGVRRSDAATARSGRPTRHYVCERAHS